MPETLPTGRLLRRGLAVLVRQVSLHPVPFVGAVLGAVVYAAATVASSWALGRVVDGVVRPRFEEGGVAAGTVVAASALVIGIGLLKAGGIVARRTAATVAKLAVESTLRSRVIDRYQRLPLSWHQAHPTGRLLAHATADVDAATEVLAPLPYATGVLVLLGVAAAWMLATDPFLAAVGLLLAPAVLVVNLAYQRRAEAPAALEQQRVGEVAALAHESFDGALVVKALGAEEAETARFRRAAEELRETKIRVATLRARFEALLDLVPSVGTVAILAIGAWRVGEGELTPGALVAFATLLSLLVWPLRLIAYVLGDLPRAVAGFDRIDAVLAAPVPSRPLKGARLPEGPAAVDVENVSFSYDGGPPVLAGIAFSLRPGTTVALVGPTGSGKSTLLLLLAGLLPPSAGRIRLSGIDLDALDDAEMARSVALAFQEPFLFGDTLAENVLLGHDPAPRALEHALAVARVDEFLAELPLGLDTVVGERGATLSGGQRQRVALARALVRRPRLLLLDDATSSVDPATEAEIVAGLPDALRSTTSVLVATRPSTIALADEVLFLVAGRLVARGSHDELLAGAPGYAHLIRAYEEEGAAT